MRFLSVVLAAVVVSTARAQLLIPIDGLSEECFDELETLYTIRDWTQAVVSYENMDALMCGTGGYVPERNEGVDQFFLEPCTNGIEFIWPECLARGGIFCALDHDQQLTIDTELGGSTRTVVTEYQCMPRACTAADYEVFVAAQELQVSLSAQTALGPNNTVTADGAIYCNHQDYPVRFGAGYKTEILLGGVTNEDVTFELLCQNGCSPQWNVALDIGASFDAAEIMNLYSVVLNNDEDFVAAGCQAHYGKLFDTFNIYCPNEHTIALGTAGNLAIDIAQFSSAGIFADEVTQEAFDTGDLEDIAIIVDDGAAAAFAPHVTLAFVSLAAVAANL